MPSDMLINRLVDGPIDVMVDADKFNEQDRINSLRMYDKYIDDTKKLVTASGQVLNFNYNKREELKQYKAITKWLTVDGKLSVAEKPCSGCVKINTCLPAGKGPHTCMVQARPPTTSQFKQDLRCVLCTLIKRDCDIFDRSRVEEDYDSIFDGSISSESEEEGAIQPVPKKLKLIKKGALYPAGSITNNADVDKNRTVHLKRGRPSLSNLSPRNSNSGGRKIQGETSKEESASVANYKKASSDLLKDFVNLQEEHRLLKPAHGNALKELDQLRKENATLKVKNEIAEKNAQLEKSRLESVAKSMLESEKKLTHLEQLIRGQQQQREKERCLAPSTAGTTPSTPSSTVVKQGSPQSVQGNREVQEATKATRHVEDIQKELKACEMQTRELRFQLGPRLEEYRHSEAKTRELHRQLGPNLALFNASEAKRKALREEFNARLDQLRHESDLEMVSSPPPPDRRNSQAH